jgi:molybdopterin-guanine dinucleotide biosynthesis protein A
VALLERVRRSLLAAGCERVAQVGADLEQPAEPGLVALADRHPGQGALGGVEAALEWAGELGEAGVLVVACDLPFLSPPLLAWLAARGGAGEMDAVLPESGGRRGIEPLCAWDATRALPAVSAALQGPDHSLHRLLATLAVEQIPLARVAEFGDPEVLFFNLNSPGDLVRAEALAASLHAPA